MRGAALALRAGLMSALLAGACVAPVLISVLLSAQATDVSVNKATAGLYRVANTPEKMLALGETKLADHIRTIGLWRNKAKNVIVIKRGKAALGRPPEKVLEIL